MNRQLMDLEEISIKLYKYCLTLTNNEWQAEDLVQETLVKLINLIQKEPDRDINLTFLYTTARNLLIDERRKKTEVPIDPGELFVGVRDFSEWDSLLEILYSTLPIRQAMLVTLKDVFQYTSEEIAQMLRVSNESIKTTLHRARYKLRENTNELPKKQISKNHDLIKEFSLAVKRFQPLKIFYYYRLLETETFKIYSNKTINSHGIYLSDPDGNILQIYSKEKVNQ